MFKTHRSSPKNATFSTPTFLFNRLMSSVLIVVNPIPSAISLPAACTATGVPIGRFSVGRAAVGDVRPGLMEGG